MGSRSADMGIFLGQADTWEGGAGAGLGGCVGGAAGVGEGVGEGVETAWPP